MCKLKGGDTLLPYSLMTERNLPQMLLLIDRHTTKHAAHMKAVMLDRRSIAYTRTRPYIAE